MGRVMTWSEILASLTTNPAAHFKASTKGRVEKDMDGDLVVLEGDPAADVRNFVKVAYTICAGKVIYIPNTLMRAPNGFNCRYPSSDISGRPM
jgi:imidazolonepropionase-like amidohydrolase